jgi:CMP-N-acetylneuraminic acid synthetase
MKNIVLITAKGGNTSIKNKNLLEMEGKTFLGWQLSYANDAKLVDEVFVSTEDDLIKKEAIRYGAKIIDRPSEYSQPKTNHGDAILHGAKAAREMLGEDIGTVTILLGNTLMNSAGDIDATIEAVNKNPEADACMTVWQAQDDHPYRAMTIGEDGYLKSFLDMKNIDTNRQSYPEVVFYDQGPWTVRYSSLIKSKHGVTGPACWWWMGDKVIPVVRLWVTGKDVHTMLDVEVSRAWIKNELWKIR